MFFVNLIKAILWKNQAAAFKKCFILSTLSAASGQSNGYCSGDWDCSSTSSSPLPCPPTPPLPLPAGGHAGAPCPEHVHTYGDLRPWEWAAPHALHRAHNKVRRLILRILPFFCRNMFLLCASHSCLDALKLVGDDCFELAHLWGLRACNRHITTTCETWFQPKGRHPQKKVAYFQALPESGGGLPMPKFFGPFFTK